MSGAERPDRIEPGQRVTVDDIRELAGAATPHFALQIRDRIARLIEDLAPDHPARIAPGGRDHGHPAQGGLLGRLGLGAQVADQADPPRRVPAGAHAPVDHQRRQRLARARAKGRLASLVRAPGGLVRPPRVRGAPPDALVPRVPGDEAEAVAHLGHDAVAVEHDDAVRQSRCECGGVIGSQVHGLQVFHVFAHSGLMPVAASS